MKHLFITAAIAIATCSCTFVKVNGKNLERIIDSVEDNVEAVFEGETTGAIISRNIPVARFDALVIKGAYDIHYSIGEPSLSITASDKLMEHLIAGVKDGVLTISTDGSRIRNWKNVDIYVSSWSLNSITCNGAMDFEANNGISAENFTLTVDGAADIEIDGLKAEKSASISISGAGDIDIERLDTKTLKLSVNGAGDAEVSGKADSADISISGAGSVDIQELFCPVVNTSRNGFGSIKR